MAWYSAGTVNVVNDSTAVGGTGSSWVTNARKGWALQLPDGKLYEIANVNSNTSITLVKAYGGPTANAQPYEVVPMHGLTAVLLEQLDSFFSTFGAMAAQEGAGAFDDGTLGSPGLRFQNDGDTGLARLGANLMALVSGGDDVLRVGPGGAVLKGLLTGTAVTQSNRDGTPGRLLKAGDFGLGGNGATVNDFSVTDNSIQSGMYGFRSTLGHLGGPPGVTAASVLHQRRAADGDESQLWIIEAGATAGYGPGAALIRTRTTGAWSGWLWAGSHDRGSNGNGQYVRMSNGLCLCWRNSMSTVSTGFSTWTYPVAFIATPLVMAQISSSTQTQFGEKVTNRTAASVDYALINNANEFSASTSMSMFALGYWHAG